MTVHREPDDLRHGIPSLVVFVHRTNKTNLPCVFFPATICRKPDTFRRSYSPPQRTITNSNSASAQNGSAASVIFAGFNTDQLTSTKLKHARGA